MIARTRQRFFALMIACLSVVMTSTNAYAAMDATLSSDHARPSDWVLLLTDDHNGRSTYQDLSSEGIQPIYLAAVTGDFSAACGGPVVARLAWRTNRGGVAFRVPGLQFGSYFLFMQTHGQCWRIGGLAAGTHGPLVLTIGGVSADNQDVAANWSVESLGPTEPQTSRQPRQPAIASDSFGQRPIIIGAIVIAALLVALVGWRQWLRHRS
jgi:hypothetical protein